MTFPASTVTPPSLSNWQMQYNGVTFGTGTAYNIIKIDGLDLAQVRNGDIARPRDTGEFVGLDLFGGRDITIDLDMYQAGNNIQTLAQTLSTAFAPPSDGQTESPLWIQLPNEPLYAVSCRVRKRNTTIDLPWSAGNYGKVTVLLHATDPRVYAPTRTGTVSLPTPLSGGTFNVTFPYSFGGGSTTGNITVANTGNQEMRPIVTITGPVTNPSISNSTLGETLTFSNPTQTSYTLNAGDTLVIDLDAHQVIYTPNGATVGSSRRSWLVSGSTWWNLPPGTNTVVFSSADASLPSPVPTCSVSWAPAYYSAT